MEAIASPLLWSVFSIFVLGMLALDLGVFSRKPHEVHHREALIWSGVWVTVAMIFAAIRPDSIAGRMPLPPLPSRGRT